LTGLSNKLILPKASHYHRLALTDRLPIILTHPLFLVLEPAVRDQLLDLLATGEPGSYAQHVALFERDFKAFYPSRLRDAHDATVALDAEDGDDDVQSKLVRHLRARLVGLREKNASLRERLKARGERIDQLTRKIERDQKT